jgi:drug/metabolite transporter (DMT)-like permease
MFVSAKSFCLGISCPLTSPPRTSWNYVVVSVIFANSQAILLLMGKLFVGTPITSVEALGALTAFAGAIVCSVAGAIVCSEDGAGSGDAASGGLLGDLLALGAGFSGVIYLVCAQTSRKNFSLFMLMFLIMIGANILVIVCQLIVLHEPLSAGIDKYHGIWGFLDVSRFDRLPLEFINVVVCNLCGAFGYVIAMQYFDSLVIAVAGLLQPVVATFIAFFIGVGLLPGLMGWVGNLLVAGGTFAVVYKPPKTKIVVENGVTVDV